MSTQYTAKAFKTRTGSPFKKLVLILVADLASDTGEARFVYSELADRSELELAQMKTLLDELETAGLLKTIFKTAESVRVMVNLDTKGV